MEYNNTVRDLIGVDLRFHETLPADGGTGEGFNNSGEALFLQPMLMERYLEAALQIADVAVVSPRRYDTVKARDFVNNDTALVRSFLNDEYDIILRIDKPKKGTKEIVSLKIDGIQAHHYQFRSTDSEPEKTYVDHKFKATLSRGVHALKMIPKGKANIREIRIRQKEPRPTGEQTKIHQRLLSLQPGENPEQPGSHVRQQLKK